jgi:hypothetical protein
LRHRNASFVPFEEQQIAICVSPGVLVGSAYRGWAAGFITSEFLNPPSSGTPMPPAFSMAVALKKPSADRAVILVADGITLRGGETPER